MTIQWDAGNTILWVYLMVAVSLYLHANTATRRARITTTSTTSQCNRNDSRGKKGDERSWKAKKLRKLSLINFTSKPEISSRFMPNTHHINCALSYCNWHILFVAIKIFMVAASFAVIAMRHAIKTTLPYNFSANYLVGGNKRLFQELW